MSNCGQLELFCLAQNVSNKTINIKMVINSISSDSKAVEVNINGQSVHLVPWLWVTAVVCLVALLIKLHEFHPSLLLAVIITQILILRYRIQTKVISEKLLVVSGLGVQSTLTFLTGKYQTRFIPWVHLIDIIIAETITMQQVLFFMAILVKSKENSKEQLYPLFMHSWPRLYCLQEIYTYCQEVLKSNFISESENPADCITRPLSYKQLMQTNYLSGPEFLTDPQGLSLSEDDLSSCNGLTDVTDVHLSLSALSVSYYFHKPL